MFAAMSLIWGVPYLLIKIAVGPDGVPVSVLVFARVAVGAALLLPLALRRGQLAAVRPVLGWLVLFSVVEIVLPWYALAQAERGISSSLTGLLIASTPVIVAVIGIATGVVGRISPVRWSGLFIGLAGVALLAGPNLVGSGTTAARAASVGEVLFVALCYAAGPLILKAKLADVPPIAQTVGSLLVATVIYAPLAALTWPSAVPSGRVLAAIAGLVVVCTAAAFLIFFALVIEAGPARASVITYINPAVAALLGVLVLGERVTPLMLAAFGIILTGSVLATRPARKPSEAAVESPPLDDLAELDRLGERDSEVGGAVPQPGGRAL
jgi:drug/metabolite transporter (DMT)-like permease